MAKKKKGKKPAKVTPAAGRQLPQNILHIGERVEEDKNVYISQPVYRQIHRFTRNKTTNESGGMLIGHVTEGFGKTCIIISGFVEAKYCEATPTTLTFTHETWDCCHKEIDKKFPGEKIVGWIHTHPNFGIFLSEYDKFIQENFFREDYQIAYVVDPIQKIEGFYFWINGKIERCKGFYLFDKPGIKLSAITDTATEPAASSGPLGSLLPTVLFAAMAVCIFVFALCCLSQQKTIDRLQQQQDALVQETNQTLMLMQQQIQALEDRIDELQAQNSTPEAEGTNEPSDTEPVK